MTIPENTEQLQLRVISYLYSAMDAKELRQFEQELATNPQLQQLLEEEQRLDSTLPIGTQPAIDEERLQGNRWLLHQNLQKQGRTLFSFRQWLSGLAEKPFTVAFQGAAMAMTFVLGVYVAAPSVAPDSQTGQGPIAGIESGFSPLQMIQDEDYEIYQLKVNSYDAATGAIDLSFSLASETTISGNVRDQNIHGLMAVALLNDIDSASRLDAIDALQPVTTGDDVYQALIHVLENDSNPGVRYQAVLSLVSLAHEDEVRDALRSALSDDVNSGVRLEAFQALAAYPEQETLQVLRQKMNTDSNEFIRAQSRVIVEAVEGSVI
ncbi:MAG: HEAT repeat domain-containing protein [Pseudohongiellaceae bacterium]